MRALDEGLVTESCLLDCLALRTVKVSDEVAVVMGLHYFGVGGSLLIRLMMILS